MYEIRVYGSNSFYKDFYSSTDLLLAREQVSRKFVSLFSVSVNINNRVQKIPTKFWVLRPYTKFD